MTLAARITRQPIAYDAATGQEARDSFADLGPEVAGLIGGMAGCSPYLWGLARREAAWLRAACDGPEAALRAELSSLAPLSLADLPGALRQSKRRVALLSALCDLGGVWALPQVTGALTDLADTAAQTALRALVAEDIRRAKIPSAVADDAETAAGMVVLAMGKMGAHELNYSSDIDLIVLYDDARYAPTDQAEARAAFIRITRRMAAMLSDITAEGYVLRTDLRLRPDAAVTPVCLSISAAETYYESLGRTWERAAYIKARPCAGDLAAGARFLRALTPFVWRKHLDFAAIQDAHDMRLRIRDHKGLGGALEIPGHNIKLGQGGIREIEFFTQTRQLIAGGRDPDLRTRETVAGLAALAAKGWVPTDVAQELTDHYTAHREVEHRLQMVQDAQTHLLPTSPEGLDRIARFCGQGDTQAFCDGLRARLKAVHRLTEGFFAPGAVPDGPELDEASARIVEGWRAYPALRSDRAVEIFKRVRPGLLARLMRAANPTEALIAFDGFLSGLPAGVQLFSLFEASPPLVDLIVDIAATAPELARYLSRNSGVLDAVLGGAFFAPWPGLGPVRADLAARMDGAQDYEKKLDALRAGMKEWHFRLGVHHLRGLIDATEAGAHYADLAEAVVGALWPVVQAEFASRHGAAPGRGAVVLGMGSLGAGRLNAGSDLDLILIYDADGDTVSDGRRPLPARTYYARLTQALVTALSAPMAEGRLYEVDMRLRPSGRQGPVATSLSSFRNYQETEAWTWEHLALTRARVITGTPGLGGEVEALRRSLIAAKAGGAAVLADVAEMRARIRAARPGSAWEAKPGPGRLMEIELLAQTMALRAASPARRIDAQLRAGAKAGLLAPDQQATLTEALRLLWPLQAGQRLLGVASADPAGLGDGARAFLLRETGATDADGLARRLAACCAAAERVIDACLGQASDDIGAQP